MPFDSAYKFMATFHHLPIDGETHFVELVKGGPDVVLARCSKMLRADGSVIDLDEVRDTIVESLAPPFTLAKLEGLGQPLHVLDMSEVQKMDGGLTCLSLRF